MSERLDEHRSPTRRESMMPEADSSNPRSDDIRAAHAYEPQSGRWSRAVAPRFIAWLDVPHHARWLDVGCGTGALIAAILDTADPAEVVGVDPSSSYIAFARRQIHDPRVRYEVGDARALPVASAQYGAVVAGLVLNHLPPGDVPAALREMARAARPGGVVAAYVWDYCEGMEPRARFWEAAIMLDAAAREHDERSRYEICTPESLQHAFERARLSAIEVTGIEIGATFSDFDDYWQPFLAGYGVASQYLLSLPADHQAAIRDRLRATLPIRPDGSFTLPIRAWAIQGIH